MQQPNLKLWSELCRFCCPVAQHTCRNHQQRSLVLLSRSICFPTAALILQQRQNLHSLTEPHVISENDTKAAVGHIRQPLHTALLILPQLTDKTRWHLDRLCEGRGTV